MTVGEATPRTGAYYRLRTRVVKALRHVPGLRALARAVLADEIASLRNGVNVRDGARPLDIGPGRFFAEGKGRTLPVVVIVATGMADDDAEQMAAAVERAQYFTGSFRPLFVIDCTRFIPFRSRGYGVEHVMPREQYAEANPRESYEEYLFGRVTSIVRAYRASSVVPLGSQVVSDALLVRLIGAR